MFQIGGGQTSKRWRECAGPPGSPVLTLNVEAAMPTHLIRKARFTGRRATPRVTYCESLTTAGVSGRGISEPLCTPGSNIPFLSSPLCKVSPDNLRADCPSEPLRTKTVGRPRPAVCGSLEVQDYLRKAALLTTFATELDARKNCEE